MIWDCSGQWLITAGPSARWTHLTIGTRTRFFEATSYPDGIDRAQESAACRALETAKNTPDPAWRTEDRRQWGPFPRPRFESPWRVEDIATID